MITCRKLVRHCSAYRIKLNIQKCKSKYFLSNTNCPDLHSL